MNALESQAAGPPPGEPSIAVVICTRDRPQSLLRTLDSVWTQTRQPDEVIIVDDGQLDHETRRLFFERCRDFGIAGKLEKTRARGLTRARNLAADVADSDVLLYLDDDVTAGAGLVQEIARLMSDPLVAGVTATVREPAFDKKRTQLFLWGYRLAGWWTVSPRGRPRGPSPRVLRATHKVEGLKPQVSSLKPAPSVRRAKWLSGAAMALRRDLVRVHRFDESLADYALGEDREFGYRLGGDHWFLQSDRARVIHRREPAARSAPRRMGCMTAHNYLYILRKTCRLSVGDRLIVAWSLLFLALMHLAWLPVGNRSSHWMQLRGMIDGLIAFFRGGSRGAISPNPSQSVEHDREGSAKARARDGSGPAAESVRTTSPQPSGLKPQASGLKPQALSPTPPRVLFVTNRLERGGAELMLASLVWELPARGIEPVIACLKDAGPLAAQCRERGVPVLDHVLRHKADAAAIPRLKRIILDHSIDVLVVAHSGGDRMFWSTLAAAASDTPIVVWSHWFPRPDMHHFEPVNRALLRFVHTFIAIGERHRLALVRHEHVPTGRITVIRNGIDPSPFQRPPTWSDARFRLRLADRHIAIAIVANLRAEKRHDVFIEAARRLARRDSNLRFFIIGDGPHRDAVHAAAAASRLSHETLRLLGPRDDVPDILRAMDVCCLCSEVECFSVSMLEAAAAGCCFVGPDTGSIPEFLEHKKTGLLIRPADVPSLADAVQSLAADSALRYRLATEARRRVQADYGIERMVDAFADLLRAVRADRRSTWALPPARENRPQCAGDATSPIVRRLVRS